MRILFVCLGNICRSPLAEAIFKHRIKEKGLHNNYEADSCATHNYEIGEPSDKRTVKNALENKIVVDHIARQFKVTDFEKFDLILTMDRNNYSQLLRFKPEDHISKRIMMMRSFDPVNRNSDVPDPYYGDEEEFQEVFDILDRSVAGLIQYLEERRKLNT